MPDPLRIIFVVGCTGCGKGGLARRLAGRLGGEIISVDSMKVYRRMDIGTAKPSPEDQAAVPYHLIDVLEPSEEYSMARFVREAEQAAADIAARGKPILAAGGTGLYIKALSEGIFEGPSADERLRAQLAARADNEGTAALHAELCAIDAPAGERIHPNDLRRIVRALEVHELTGRPISELQTQWERDRTRHDCVFIGLRREREDQNRRTNMRVKRLIDLGWVDEVRALLSEPQSIGPAARQALGYPELIEHVEGRLPLDDAVERIKIATRRFAKAQRTWQKRFRNTHWFDVEPDENADVTAERVLDRWESMCST